MLVNMTASDQNLLRQFTHEPRTAAGQDAFTALVRLHLNLVYSAALRQVRSPQLAEEVCQSVFTNLACHAATLDANSVLTAWLYQVTRHTAIDVVRREARRQAREQIAFQMSTMNDSPSTEWTHIEPLLDEAMDSLDAADRTAILLRFFENKSLREVGEALGASEDAAQKRVSRAVERLREYFGKRKVAVGASGLIALLSANAVQAAPAGLAGTIATGAAMASTAAATTTAIAITKSITMTTLTKITIATAVAGAVTVCVFQARQVSSLRAQVQSLEQQEQQNSGLSNLVQELRHDRDRATNALAALTAENAGLKKNPNDVLRLRGEVGRLQQENATIGSSSALSKVAASAESRKLLRDQQKLGMGMIYKGFAKQMNLTKEQTDKLNDLLADHVMEVVGHVSTVLRDKLPAEQMNALFAAQEAALQEKVQALLGPDGLAQYQDYSKNLVASLTADQFSAMLWGTGPANEDKIKQFKQVLLEETQSALTSAGLPADYQAVPILNFANMASEQQANVSLKLLDDIYQRTAARSSSFLSADELEKFQSFRGIAITNSRTALAMNRTMMAPLSR
jgi:RNA polymerase sigma factor (sigma-70 family)